MWTTATPTFQPRHWLVLHTYLYHHPNLTLDVFATHLPLDFFEPLTRWGYRVRVQRIDDELLASLGQTCPGAAWLARLDEWRAGPYFYSHLTDYLRFCLLYRDGGVYSDFDALLLQPLPVRRPGFIGKDVSRATAAAGACAWCLPDGYHYLAPGVMGAVAGAPVLREALRSAFDPATYNVSVFNAVGPRAITAAYLSVQPSPAELTVYEPDVLYPLPYWRAHELLGPPGPAPTGVVPGPFHFARLARHALSLHLFGHMTGRLPVEPGSVVDAASAALTIVDTAASVIGADPADPSRAPGWRLMAPSYVGLARAVEPALRTCRVVPTTAAFAARVRVAVTTSAVPLGLATRAPPGAASASRPTLHLAMDAPGSVAEANAWLARVYLDLRPLAGSAWDGLDELVVTVQVLPARDDHSPRAAAPAPTATLSARVAVYDVSRLLTVMIKTMDRMDKVFELLRSLRALYPSVPVIVADDGERAQGRGTGGSADFEYLPLPYDVGLSAGRNAMLDRVRTPLVLTLDDDFLLDADAVVAELVHVVATQHADIAAGRNPVDEGLYGFEFNGLLERNGTVLTLLPGSRRSLAFNCRVVDIVPNLFVARTDVLRSLRWDPALKLGEHEDFFLRARAAGLTVATCASVSFTHAGSRSWFQLSPASSTYDRLRSRIHRYWEVALRKHGLTRLVSFGTVVLDLAGPAAVADLAVGEVLPTAMTVYWAPSECATAYELVIHQVGTGSASASVRAEYASCPVLVLDLTPATTYSLTVYALIAHVRETVGRTITVHTRPALRGTCPPGATRRAQRWG